MRRALMAVHALQPMLDFTQQPPRIAFFPLADQQPGIAAAHLVAGHATVDDELGQAAGLLEVLLHDVGDLGVGPDVEAEIVAALDAGVHAIGKKVVEEAAEVWMAAEHESAERTAEEISQLLYHLQVLMLARGLSTTDVYRHL